MTALGNWPLWRKVFALNEVSGLRGVLFVMAFAGAVAAVSGALLSLLAWPRVMKPVATVLLMTSAALSHFIASYGIVIDATMAANVLETDLREARDLLSVGLLSSMLLLGALPLWWLLRQSAPPSQTLGRQVLGNLGSFVVGILLAVALALLVFADLASTMRNHKSFRYMVTPLNALFSFATAAQRAGRSNSRQHTVIGADAHLTARPANAKPPLLLLVVGETARAMNFSLNGYGRSTNPALAELPVLSFRQVKSCGTSTAASLPCMFSPYGREESVDRDGTHDNLLDVLQRAGLSVLWLDNQSGCKGLCDRIPNSFATKLPAGAVPMPPALCRQDGLGRSECFDEAMLHELDLRMQALDPLRLARGAVVVMHQLGSHGPAYYKRSPPDLKHFLPECRSNALQLCPREHVVNSYDNSIVATDRLLARSVAWLHTQADRFDPGMLYVSDHGEFLGERGLYLHGLPYAFAPIEQVHVPMIFWIPQRTSTGWALNLACIERKLDAPLSHQNLFHTVMGWVGARADVYRSELDVLASCRD